ncbi:hypothetical protein D3C71_2079670 [compost metagenome]
MALITEIHQGPQTFIHPENNVAAAAAVTTGWPAFRHILFTPERYQSIASVAAFNINLSLIYEHSCSPSLHLQR